MFLVENMHLAKDALHIYVALGVFFGSCLLFGWKASQWRPVMAVLAVALAGESWDLYDTLAAGEAAAFGSHAKDLVNTLMLPTIIMLIARHSRVFRRG